MNQWQSVVLHPEMTTQHIFESSPSFLKVWMHLPPVLLFVEVDPSFLLVVGYNLFPRPLENEGDSIFVGSRMIVVFCEGAITIFQSQQNESVSSAAQLDKTTAGTYKLTISVVDAKATRLYHQHQANQNAGCIMSKNYSDQPSVCKGEDASSSKPLSFN